jgi:hypothetical protein
LAGATTFDYAGRNDWVRATTMFSVGTPADVTVGYSWQDLVYSYGSAGHDNEHEHESTTGLVTVNELNSKFSWQLFNGNTLIDQGTVRDGRAASGAGTLSFSDLNAGTYSLRMTGEWLAQASHHAQLVTAPSVTLMAPVPEPETYAMFLAGLGLMGVIAKRRRNV